MCAGGAGAKIDRVVAVRMSMFVTMVMSVIMIVRVGIFIVRTILHRFAGFVLRLERAPANERLA
jgi:hypothetical protein